MPANGTIALTLDSLTAAGTGTKATPGTEASTLPSLTMAATGRTGITQSSTISFTLDAVTVAVAGGKWTGVGAFSLQSISIHAAGHSGITGSGTAAFTLGKLRTVITAQPPNYGVPFKIICVTGIATSTGAAIFQFQGTPNLGVSWSLITGSGSITPVTNYTDENGQAFAIYEAGGYTGQVTVECAYVT